MRLLRPFLLVLALAGLAPSLWSQGRAPARMGRVRGIVIDSLLGAPLPGATVSIPQAGRVTRTDSGGRFVLDSIPPGEWAIGFHHGALDSLGFSDFGSMVRVFAGASASIELVTPSFATLRPRFCAETPDSLSPTVAYGAVRSSDTKRVHVEISLRWLAEGDAGRAAPTVRTSPLTDSEAWVACGVSRGAWVHLTVRDTTREVAHEVARSGSILFHIGARGIAVHDVLLAPGFADIGGSVRDGDGRPVRGARVSVVDTGIDAETDAWGAFTLTRVPAGTRTLDVRAAGFHPWVAPAWSGNDDVHVTLRPLRDQDTGMPAGSDRLRFEERRGRTGQIVLDGEALEADTATLAQHAPPGTCRWWLDGRPVEREFALAQPRASWRAIERYAAGVDAPPEYRSTGCAVFLLWTAAADW
ncbi:MAG: carboxypeptidase regulatory-like domain-containing protein [Gemmatimonadetes bacterium]|nr:carboxypeptidase regulatory-like domain-containing protein [Gemmatimonadota bacterium]